MDNQIEALQEYCKNNNYAVAGIYNDAGISARKKFTRRPALLRLLEDCKANKVDIILITKLDRFFRSVPDYYAVMDQINVPWRAIWEDYETETSSGIFKVNIMLSVAQSEADRTSERIKSTMTYKRERGDYIGSAPIGYLVKGRDLVKNQDAVPGMNAFFEKYLATFSMTKAVEAAAASGLKLSRNHMLKLIKNPAYYGITNQGYQCEPYITKEQYDLIISNLAKNARISKYTARNYLFSGLCVCGYCGHRMPSKAVMRTHADGTKVTHKKYVCQYTTDMRFNCPHLQISEPMLETFLLNELEALLEAYRAKVSKINSSIDINGFKKKKELEAKLKRLATLYADGDIDLEEYRLKRDNTKEEISKIVIEPLAEPALLPAEWKEIYVQLDDEHKRAFWLKTIKSITITNENKAHPEVEFL